MNHCHPIDRNVIKQPSCQLGSASLFVSFHILQSQHPFHMESIFFFLILKIPISLVSCVRLLFFFFRKKAKNLSIILSSNLIQFTNDINSFINYKGLVKYTSKRRLQIHSFLNLEQQEMWYQEMRNLFPGKGFKSTEADI